MSVSRYMLDTNTVSYLIRGQSASLVRKLRSLPLSAICISAITEAELLRGVAKKPEAKRLPILVKEFLLRVDSLAWGSDAAECYAQLKTQSERMGKSLGTMDMLIASHAQSVDAVLVSHDKAFYNFQQFLQVEDWVV